MSNVEELLEHTCTDLSESSVKQWLYDYITSILEIERSEIDASTPIYKYGLDSSAVVGMIADLGEWSGQTMSIKAIKKNNTIEKLAQFVAQNAN